MRVCMLTVGRSAFTHVLYAKEAASLVRAGHEVTIIAPCLEGEDPHDPAVNYLDLDVIPLMTMGWGTRRQKLMALPKLFSLARRQPCDTYQVMEPQSLLVGAIAKLFTRRKLVYDSREHYPLALAVNTGVGPLSTRLLYGLFWLFEAVLIFLFVDHVFGVDQGCIKRFRRFGKPTSLLTNYPSRDFAPAELEERREPRAAPFQLLFTGVTRRRIAVLETIRAVAILREQGYEVEATFLGMVDDAPFVAECHGLIQQLDLESAIRITGRVPHSEVRGYLETADCGSLLYLPTPYTEYVTHPVKLFEYMAYGLPVLCSNLPKMAGFVHEHEVGLAADPADPDSIARATARLICSPGERAGYGRNGRQAFLHEFNWEALEPHYVGVFERLQPSRSAPEMTGTHPSDYRPERPADERSFARPANRGNLTNGDTSG
jgi:glycosyltransferase involved in cell wall biosynthesis